VIDHALRQLCGEAIEFNSALNAADVIGFRYLTGPCFNVNPLGYDLRRFLTFGLAILVKSSVRICQIVSSTAW